jgi:hypothetical protein
MVGVATPGTYDLMQELDLLEPRRVRLFRDEFEELYLREGETEAVGPLSVQRAFPVHHAGEFIVLKNHDGQEVGIVRRVRDLDRVSRAVLEDELEWTYFAASISAVHSIEIRFHIPHWDVDTDRGRRVFELRSSRRDIRLLPNGRVLMRDADGNRYEIPDVDALDETSRAVIEDYV